MGITKNKSTKLIKEMTMKTVIKPFICLLYTEMVAINENNKQMQNFIQAKQYTVKRWTGRVFNVERKWCGISVRIGWTR